MNEKRIGMIGIGLMGHGIASNIQRAGWSIGFLDHPGNQSVGAMRQGVIPRIPGGLESAPQRDFTIVSHNK